MLRTLLFWVGFQVSLSFVFNGRFAERLVPVTAKSKTVENVIEPPKLPTTSIGIQPIELTDEMKKSFMSYAMSTILSRALPDARDGLKPVHRRVLYAMEVLKLGPQSSYRKCARIVGEVLGKYHPHGDQSVYDALVRMAQDFVMLHPLVAGHGNFGSIDNDPPAAMRYTEAKLSAMCYDTFMQDIGEDAVDFVSNFDGNEQEPVILPARLPMLLINGASGIAVGMATNIPPHNLGEVVDAVIALIDKPKLSDQELFKIVPGPDFPTGGEILGKNEALSLYKTGHGSIRLRAKSHMETLVSGAGNKLTRNAIVVTELPYGTNKAVLLEKIAELVNDKKLLGVSDLRDESDRDGLRIVIELKRDAVPAIVQNNLFKKTALQTSFSGNMLALVESGTQPRRITLREALNIFIKFRFDTIRRRTGYQLSKLQSRHHLVIGMIQALGKIDSIIQILKRSKDSASAKEALMTETFNFTAPQAEAILGLTLRRLTSLEENKLTSERDTLQSGIEQLTRIMTNDTEVYQVIKSESLELKRLHAVPRRTQISSSETVTDLKEEDLIANDRSVIVITSSGYVKRVPVEEFEAQNRGGKGKIGAKLSSEMDGVDLFFTCNDHDSVLFVSKRGVAYSVKAHQIPLASRTAKGVPLPQVLPITAEDAITTALAVNSFAQSDSEYLTLLTEQGVIKRTPLKAFSAITARGLTVIHLDQGDALKWVRRCGDKDEVVVVTRKGFGAKFKVSDVTATGRTSRGVKSLRMRPGDVVAAMDIMQVKGGLSINTNTSAHLLTVTDRGFGKLTKMSAMKNQKRGGKGSIVMKFKDSVKGSGNSTSAADGVRCMRICEPEDDVVVSSLKGVITRVKVSDISVQSRRATGVKLQGLQADDRVTMLDVIRPDSTPDDDTAASGGGDEVKAVVQADKITMAKKK